MVDRILGYIGSYYVKLNGQVDALVFAGGIGEKSALLRRTLVEQCRSLGVAIDHGANDKGPGDETVKDISLDGKGPRVLICQTNEQVRPWLNFALLLFVHPHPRSRVCLCANAICEYSLKWRIVFVRDEVSILDLVTTS